MDEMRKQVLAHRYEKIEESITKTIKEWADQYISDFGLERWEDDHGKITKYNISEEKANQEAIEDSCDGMLTQMENMFGRTDIYWITELILEEKFGHEMSKINPYRIEKKMPKFKAEISVMGIPVIKMEE